ncbi:hypothetical protein AAG570_007186 [Ranatra chinensis]|uniref:Enoyl-CoA hydratase n=1 Tax=Ranatra chinensis TaxID=642074 RepID=A0ABD0XX20_9HEMI
MSSAGSFYKGVPLYDYDPVDVREAKRILSEFGGGSVDLTLDDRTGMAKLVLNNPSKKNALSGKMIAEFSDAVDRLEALAGVRSVVVTGAQEGGGFCTGGDLEFVKRAASPHMGVLMSTVMTDALTRLADLPVVSTAYINASGALGGGAEIAFACDHRLMTPDSRIGLIHVRLGIVPAWGGIAHLLRNACCPRSTALDFVTSGRILTAGEAVARGLATRVVADEAEAEAWLGESVGGRRDPAVGRAAKAAFLAAHDTTTQTRIFANLFGGVENKKALDMNLKHKQ